jgi:exopolysaccharide biosynthesis polyprenyl glycosylphosphotransferase
MRAFLKQFEMTVVLLLKAALYISLFFSFFLLFSLRDKQILVASRTMAVTMISFAFVEAVMTAIYGKYDIGKRKSKPIIYSVFLATLITDVFTYVLLQIMNTNPNYNERFRLDNLWILFLVIVVQLIFIIVMTYFGNYVFFIMSPPEKCCIITSSQKSVDEIIRGVCKYKKQYRIMEVVDYRKQGLNKIIMRCDTVFLYDVPVQERTELLDFCYHNSRNVYFNPEVSDVLEINSKHIMLDDVSLISKDFKELSLEQRFVKRTMDIVLAIISLVIASPFMIVSAIAIKANDGGSIFFKQNRATKDGKIFAVYKFRTMKEHVENYSATDHDDRITKVGAVLRKYRLDELPQLFNILRGDMSFVGPRPEMLANIYSYTKALPEFEYRLRVKAGLTGYAQIMGKYNTSPKDKLILDLMYIESYSFWKDLQLLFQTIMVLLRSEDSTEGFHKEKDTEKESEQTKK